MCYKLSYELKNHIDKIYCLKILIDGRLVSSSEDKSIKIYNKDNYLIDFQINEHSDGICYISQLKDGTLISCSYDKTIKLFKLYEKNYYEIQTINENAKKIIELTNKDIVSISSDFENIEKSMKIYSIDKINNKNNNRYNIYRLSSSIKNESQVYDMIEINNNEIICVITGKLIFWDIRREYKNGFINIDDYNNWNNQLIKLNNNIIIHSGDTIINVIDIEKKCIIKSIINNNIFIKCIEKFSDTMFVVGDDNGKIYQWYFDNINKNIVEISMRDDFFDEGKEIKCIKISKEGKIYIACNNEIKILEKY